MSEAKFLVCQYDAELEFDLENLGIDSEQIEDYYVKYGKLYITFKNGDFSSYDTTYDREIDWKWSEKETFYDVNYREVIVI
jgi:hypothetical protein|tara:strand:+ start:3565 stop:3807 length:243 start_codon:yes stop_codon:yes gene_type:complete